MYHIVVVPEQLRVLSERLRQTAADLNALGGRIGGAMSGLDWETRHKAGVEGQVGDARSRATALANQAEVMARYLAVKAQAFEEADIEGAQNLEVATRPYWKDVVVPVVAPTPTPVPSPSQAQSALDILWDGASEVLERVDWLSLVPLSALMLMQQTDVLGRMHVYGPQWLKAMAGVNEKLTIVRPENLSWHMLRDALKLSTSPFANLLTVAGLVPTIIGDWQKYSGQSGAKLGAAILVDSALEITLNKGFQIGGAIVGGMLTPVLGPWGPVLGYAVGGVVGSYASDWVRSTPVYDKVLETTARSLEVAGKTVDQVSQAVADGVSRGLEVAAKAINEASERVTQALDNVLDSVIKVSLPSFQLSW